MLRNCPTFRHTLWGIAPEKDPCSHLYISSNLARNSDAHMNFLIDGHNLIGQMPGISLSDEDDEAKLVMVLRGFATADRRRSLVIVFDHGVYGHPSLNGYGITCHFARSPQDADEQIITRIGKIERPSEWRVITSDRIVARAAADRNIHVISSHDFARQLSGPPPQTSVQPVEKPRDVRLSPAQVNEWLRIFGEQPEEMPESPAPPSPPPVKRAGVRKKRVRKK